MTRHHIQVCGTVNGKPYLRLSWFEIQESDRHSWAFCEAIDDSQYQFEQKLRQYYWRREAIKIMPGMTIRRFQSQMDRKTVWLNGERKWGRA